MQELAEQCTCAPRDWDGEYWKHTWCAACETWSEEHSKLVDELHLKPWERVENPDAANPYRAGTAAAQKYEDDRDAKAAALWRDLEAAIAIGDIA
jgi:hypothetical protein